ncbi:serine protease grass-like [Drosophila simulans]|uniref:GD11197 n=1 Tax=Drosophila simulans TaxID=7240 RepID=B4QHZ4_DROSI|nr:serine protease grass-like [Drosophila simulans]EDX07365.1 GD11197 [Drosophila simulans]
MSFLKAYATLSLILSLGKLGSMQLLDRGCIPPAYGARVTGGQNARRAPWMAYITLNGKYKCGGSLIASSFVLTAAHCAKQNYTSLIVKLGEYDSSTTLDGPTVSFRVKQVLKHPYYETRTYSNDIALLKLHRKTNYNAQIRPICILLSPKLRPVIDSIRKFTVTGWGTKSAYHKKASNILKQMHVHRFDKNPDCRNRREKFCGSNTSQFICYGDSGCPLWAYIRYYGIPIYAQFGLASQVSSRLCNGFGFYTDVYNHTEWIYHTVRRHW